MKLIIDIPKSEYMEIKRYYDSLPEYSTVEAERYYIALGTPLDNVTSRISELRDSWKTDGYEDEAEALNVALRYIDEEVRKHDRTDHI